MSFRIEELCLKFRKNIKKITPQQTRNILMIAVLSFILINSMLGGTVSTWLSQIPRKIVQLFIPYGKIKWLDVFLILKIRKFAHFLEYMVFGILVSKYYLYKKRNLYRLINSVYIVLSIAFIDETIQLISKRQSLVSDIWLDLFGGIVGILLYLVYKYYRFQKENKEENKWK